MTTRKNGTNLQQSLTITHALKSNLKVSITLHLQLCSVRYIVLQMYNKLLPIATESVSQRAKPERYHNMLPNNHSALKAHWSVVAIFHSLCKYHSVRNFSRLLQKKLWQSLWEATLHFQKPKKKRDRQDGKGSNMIPTKYVQVYLLQLAKMHVSG